MIATRGTRTGGFAVEEALAEAAMEISEFQEAVESAAQTTPGFGALLVLAMISLGMAGARRRRK